LIFTPLAGRLWVEDWRTGDADIMERPLDADDAVHILSEAFENQKGGRFSQINQPLYMPSSREAELILAQHCAFSRGGRWNWGLPPATRAYVGVGSLDSSRHRLTEFLRRYEADDPSARQSYLAGAGHDLMALRDTCRRSRLPLPGDIGNRLFPTLPLPSEIATTDSALRKLRRDLAQVSARVRRLNERAVIMSWEHLRDTRSVRVIGGGRSKRRPLWTILLAASFDAGLARSQGGATASSIVNELTTDRDTANLLLEEIRLLRDNQMLLEHYHEMCSVIGL
jgi:hypothetical protein